MAISLRRFQARQLIGSVRESVRGSSLYAPIRRWRLGRIRRHPDAYPNWREFLRGHEADWDRAIESLGDKRVLIATNLGFHFTANTIDSLLAAALVFNGVRPDILLCDGALPACQVADHTNSPSVERYAEFGPRKDFCGECFAGGAHLYSELGLRPLRLSTFMTPEDQPASIEYAEEMLASGAVTDEHAIAGTLRYFGRDKLRGDKLETAILKRYLRASYLSGKAAGRLFDQTDYSAVVAHHGIYVPQGRMAETARERKLDLVTWHAGYREKCFIFNHEDTYHRSMQSEPEESWNQPLTKRQAARLEEYLKARESGRQDWISFQKGNAAKARKPAPRIALDPRKPTALLLANVPWDAKLHYPNSAYQSMMDWIEDTVRFFVSRPDLQLIIRSHPGEVLNSPKAQDRVDGLIASLFPDVPPNIVVIGPEDDRNTYTLAQQADVALIYNTKMGIEMAARGMPVIVAGDAWIRDKGVSADATTQEEYLRLLDAFPDMTTLDDDKIERARRYAYHFFFRRYIAIESIERVENDWPMCRLKKDVVARIRKKDDPGLEAILAGIIKRAPFEYDELNPDDQGDRP